MYNIKVMFIYNKARIVSLLTWCEIVSQTEGYILRRSHLQTAYAINPGLFQLAEHYIRES